jgi:hypothetical protein
MVEDGRGWSRMVEDGHVLIGAGKLQPVEADGETGHQHRQIEIESREGGEAESVDDGHGYGLGKGGSSGSGA